MEELIKVIEDLKIILLDHLSPATGQRRLIRTSVLSRFRKVPDCISYELLRHWSLEEEHCSTKSDNV